VVPSPYYLHSSVWCQKQICFQIENTLELLDVRLYILYIGIKIYYFLMILCNRSQLSCVTAGNLEIIAVGQNTFGLFTITVT